MLRGGGKTDREYIVKCVGVPVESSFRLTERLSRTSRACIPAPKGALTPGGAWIGTERQHCRVMIRGCPWLALGLTLSCTSCGFDRRVMSRSAVPGLGGESSLP